MKKPIALILALSVVTCPLVARADSDSGDNMGHLKIAAGKASGDSCQTASNGAVAGGKVVGVGADWWGPNIIGIDFQADGFNSVYSQTATVNFDTDAGKQLYLALSEAYMSGDHVQLYCSGGGRFTSAWIGK